MSLGPRRKISNAEAFRQLGAGYEDLIQRPVPSGTFSPRTLSQVEADLQSLSNRVSSMRQDMLAMETLMKGMNDQLTGYMSAVPDPRKLVTTSQLMARDMVVERRIMDTMRDTLAAAVGSIEVRLEEMEQDLYGT